MIFSREAKEKARPDYGHAARILSTNFTHSVGYFRELEFNLPIGRSAPTRLS